MNIVWLESGPVQAVHSGGYTSPFAGVRYRTLSPAGVLAERGARVRIVQLATVSRAGELPGERGDVLVCSRIVPPTWPAMADTVSRALECVREARQRGMAVVVDANDRHHEVPEIATLLAQVMSAAHVVVAGSSALADLVGPRIPIPARVIGDPYEYPEAEATFAPPERAGGSLMRLLLHRPAKPNRAARLLWFGHQSNLVGVFGLIPRLSPLLASWSLHLQVVTAPGCGAERVSNEVNRDFAPRLTMGFTPWSPAGQLEALEACDLVVIPSDVGSAANVGKTANRLIESLRRGRFVVANPLPSYLEFSGHAWIGDSVPEGIEWALRHPRQVLRRLASGQRHVAERYSPQAIAAEWGHAIAEAQRLAAG